MKCTGMYAGFCILLQEEPAEFGVAVPMSGALRTRHFSYNLEKRAKGNTGDSNTDKVPVL